MTDAVELATRLHAALTAEFPQFDAAYLAQVVAEALAPSPMPDAQGRGRTSPAGSPAKGCVG